MLLPLLKIDPAHPGFVIQVLDITVTPLVEAPLPKYKFKNADYNIINESFGKINWHSLLNSSGAEEACNIFYDSIKTVLIEYVPKKTYFNNNKYPVWYSQALIKIIKEKRRAHKNWKKIGNDLDYDKFFLLRKRQRRVTDMCFKKFTEQVEKFIKYSPKAFWTYIKSMRRGSNYPKEMKYRGNNISNGRYICDAFNDFFKNVFGVPSSDPPEEEGISMSSDEISGLCIEDSLVERHLGCLDVSKGAGCDEIPPLFWRNCA